MAHPDDEVAAAAARMLNSLIRSRRQLASRVVPPVSFHHRFGFVAAMGTLAQPFWVPPVQAAVGVVGLLVWGWALRSYYLSAGRTLLVQRKGTASLWPILLAVMVPTLATIAAAQSQSVLVASVGALAILFTYVAVLPRGDAAWARGLERDVARIERPTHAARHTRDAHPARGGDHAVFDGPYRSEICSVLAAVQQAEIALLRLALDIDDHDLTPQVEALEAGGHVRVKRGFRNRSTRPQAALTKDGRRAYRDHLVALNALASPR